MSFRTSLMGAAGALLLASAAFAESAISIEDPYARTSTPGGPTGAAFMVLTNSGDEDDRLVSATSEISERVELHTHEIDANGVARMMEVEEGFAVPAGGSHVLARGGDHVMFMGIAKPLTHGDVVSVTLTFEKAGDITIDVPIDLERKAGAHDHGAHGSDG